MSRFPKSTEAGTFSHAGIDRLYFKLYSFILPSRPRARSLPRSLARSPALKTLVSCNALPQGTAWYSAQTGWSLPMHTAVSWPRGHGHAHADWKPPQSFAPPFRTEAYPQHLQSLSRKRPFLPRLLRSYCPEGVTGVIAVWRLLVAGLRRRPALPNPPSSQPNP